MGCVNTKTATHVIDKSKLKLDTRPPINSAKSQPETSKQPQSQPNTPSVNKTFQRKSTVNQPVSPLPFRMDDENTAKPQLESSNARRTDSNANVNAVGQYTSAGKAEIVLVESLSHCNPEIVGFDWSKAVNDQDELAELIVIPEIQIAIK